MHRDEMAAADEARHAISRGSFPSAQEFPSIAPRDTDTTSWPASSIACRKKPPGNAVPELSLGPRCNWSGAHRRSGKPQMQK